jgi:cytochrome c553
MRSWLTAVGLAAAIALAGAPALASAQTGAPRAAPKGDRELGQHLSSECVACHQISGRVAGGVPAIVGWPEDQFVAVMLSYKNKDRDNQVMRTIAGRLSMEEIEALAAYFGELPQ